MRQSPPRDEGQDGLASEFVAAFPKILGAGYARGTQPTRQASKRRGELYNFFTILFLHFESKCDSLIAELGTVLSQTIFPEVRGTQDNLRRVAQ